MTFLKSCDSLVLPKSELWGLAVVLGVFMGQSGGLKEYYTNHSVSAPITLTERAEHLSSAVCSCREFSQKQVNRSLKAGVEQVTDGNGV